MYKKKNYENNIEFNNKVLFQAICELNPVKLFLMSGFYHLRDFLKEKECTRTPVDKMIQDLFNVRPYMRPQLDEFLRTNSLIQNDELRTFLKQGK